MRRTRLALLIVAILLHPTVGVSAKRRAVRSPSPGPAASADSYDVSRGGTLVVTAANGVLANDRDPLRRPLQAILVTTAAHGSLVLNADGSFTYAHDSSSDPTDSFTYTASTGTSTSSPATVTISITPDLPNEITVTLPGSVPLVVVRIRAGTFQMGSPASEQGRGSRETLHQVTLTSDYYMGKYEITEQQWSAVMGEPPRHCEPTSGSNYPVGCVDWDEITGPNGFLQRLDEHLTSTAQPGAGKYRLPTEAEWEMAARGGTQTRFSFGDALGNDGCGSNPTADPYAWWCANAIANSVRSAQPVGTKLPNPFGLFDMHGNVWEWCQDWGGEDYPASPQVDPAGPATGTYRVARGGSWYYNLEDARSAERTWGLPSGHFINGQGFRVARSR